MVWEDGKRVVKPMRYQCRAAGKPVSYDRDYNGTYNARRDNLEGFWRGQFGVSHGLIIADAFFENVWKHAAEGCQLAPGEKEENAVIEFRPNTGEGMLLACLWSRWTDRSGKDPDLLSFALITDDPPPEVMAAGHDRCPIPIKEEHIDAWLNPDFGNLAAQYAILDDRERPYFEHRLAA
jgi:putative SOS response-associated peptidase YedK